MKIVSVRLISVNGVGFSGIFLLSMWLLFYMVMRLIVSVSMSCGRMVGSIELF